MLVTAVGPGDLDVALPGIGINGCLRHVFSEQSLHLFQRNANVCCHQSYVRLPSKKNHESVFNRCFHLTTALVTPFYHLTGFRLRTLQRILVGQSRILGTSLLSVCRRLASSSMLCSQPSKRTNNRGTSLAIYCLCKGNGPITYE